MGYDRGHVCADSGRLFLKSDGDGTWSDFQIRLSISMPTARAATADRSNKAGGTRCVDNTTQAFPPRGHCPPAASADRVLFPLWQLNSKQASCGSWRSSSTREPARGTQCAGTRASKPSALPPKWPTCLLQANYCSGFVRYAADYFWRLAD
jgi:hypothetical protein